MFLADTCIRTHGHLTIAASLSFLVTVLSVLDVNAVEPKTELAVSLRRGKFGSRHFVRLRDNDSSPLSIQPDKKQIQNGRRTAGENLPALTHPSPLLLRCAGKGDDSAARRNFRIDWLNDDTPAPLNPKVDNQQSDFRIAPQTNYQSKLAFNAAESEPSDPRFDEIDMPEIVAPEPVIGEESVIEQDNILVRHEFHDPASCPECKAFLANTASVERRAADSKVRSPSPAQRNSEGEERVRVAKFSSAARQTSIQRAKRAAEKRERISSNRVTTKSVASKQRTPSMSNSSAQFARSQFARSQKETGREDFETAPVMLQENTGRQNHDGLWLEDDESISQLSIGIGLKIGDAPGEKLIPENEAEQRQGSYDSAINVGSGVARSWAATGYSWEAPSLYHRPLYFEQVNLERYGHFHKNWHIQSALSMAHFFATVPALPLEMWIDPPCERVYTLGHHRPGDCNPHQHHWRP